MNITVYGYAGKSVSLNQTDIDLLRLMRDNGQAYSSDNDSRWDRIFRAKLTQPVPDQGADWYGGWIRLSPEGEVFLKYVESELEAQNGTHDR